MHLPKTSNAAELCATLPYTMQQFRFPNRDELTLWRLGWGGGGSLDIQGKGRKLSPPSDLCWTQHYFLQLQKNFVNLSEKCTQGLMEDIKVSRASDAMKPIAFLIKTAAPDTAVQSFTFFQPSKEFHPNERRSLCGSRPRSPKQLSSFPPQRRTLS